MKTSKIKILYIISSLKQSGPATQLLGILSNLDKDKFDVRVLTLSPEPINSKKNEFIKDGILVDSLNLSRIMFGVKGEVYIKKYINQYLPDIIHTTGFRSDIAISKMDFKSSHCVTIRNYAYEDYTALYGKIIGSFMAYNTIKYIKRCSYVICCSNSIRSMYERVLSSKYKLYVIQNGIDTLRFAPVSNENIKKDLRYQLGLPQDRIIFLSVGHLSKRKDPLTVIKAFRSVESNDKALLIMLGDGELAKQCKAEESENIVFKGYVKNVKEYMQSSDVYISASKSEGLPNSVLEAGCCGMNLILSDIPQHVEIFETQSSFAEFFSVEDSKSLAVKVNEAIGKNLVKINYNVAEYMKETFNSNVMSKNYENMYCMMLQNKSQNKRVH